MTIKLNFSPEDEDWGGMEGHFESGNLDRERKPEHVLGQE